MKLTRSLAQAQARTVTLVSHLSLASIMSLLLLIPWNWASSASAQIPFVVLSVSPANGAQGVSINTNVVATFSLPLIRETVNTQTFLVLQGGQRPVAGVVTAIGTQAIFTPLQSLPTNTTFVVRIVGGPNGVRGSRGGGPIGGGTVPLANDFISTFTTGAGSTGEGTPVSPSTGGTVADPRTGAATEIPANTLKVQALVNIITLDSAARIGQIHNNCGIPIQPGEQLPDVPNSLRATEVVRYEVDPCETIAFGPGMRLTLPLVRSLFPTGLPLGTSLRLYQLARSGDQLVFLDTGITAKVTRPGVLPLFGSFATVPAIPAFGTYAAFVPGTREKLPPSRPNTITSAQSAARAQQTGGIRLYFPLISQTNGRQTRISIANPDSSASLNVTFTGYLEDGSSVGSQSRTVAANRQASFMVSALFPGFTSGAIVAQGQGSGAMTGFYEIADNFGAPTMLAGAAAIQTPQAALVFPVIKSLGEGFSEVHVFNPNASPVSINLAGFTLLGTRIDPTDTVGQPLGSITLPAFGTLVVSSSESSSSSGVQLDFTELDGGYVIAEPTGGQTLTGGEMFGDLIGGQLSLAVLNSLPFPSGCLASMTASCACQVDTSPEATVPSSLRQYTLYATYLESNPAEQILYLVNVSESPADVAVSAFSELGQFRATFPPSGFLTVGPHQVVQASVLDLFGFNPSPGYVRVEDQNASFVGGIINRNAVSGRFQTVVPLIADDPQLTQTATSTFFSRVQLDPASANPRLTTGMLIFNPTNNSLQFRIKITDTNGRVRQSQTQSVGARGTFTRVLQSLNVLFPNVTLSSGFAQVQVTTVPGPGMGGRLLPVAVYRTSSVVSAVPEQKSQP